MVKPAMSELIGINGKCNNCGSPTFSYLCNSNLLLARPESGDSDYWVCCGNITCPNHYGEGYLFYLPEWVESALHPVPLSSRHPEPSDCDSNGCCWLADVIKNPLRLEWYWDNTPADPAYKFWLPYNADTLPVKAKGME